MIENNNKVRTCILIVGMHRCGTSATAGCLSLLGYSVGKNQMAANPFNEKGYYENNSIYQFNEELLETINATWKRTILLPDNWWYNQKIVEKKNRLVEIISKEYGNTDDFILKDPRVSKLLPFYLMVFEELNISTKVIINYRNPFEVAESLKKRDNLSIPNSLNLYTDSILSSLHYAKSLERILLNYSDLLIKPVDTFRKISNNLKLKIEFTKAQIAKVNEFIEPNLKHHKKESQLPGNYPKYAYELYGFLIKNNLQVLPVKFDSEIEQLNNEFYNYFSFFTGIDFERNIRIDIDYHSKVETIEYPVNFGFNSISINTRPGFEINKIVIYPIATQAAIGISQVSFRNTENQIAEYVITNSNAEFIGENGIYIFETETPLLIVEKIDLKNILEINFNITYHSIGSNTYLSSVNFRNNYERNLNNIIKQQNEQYKSLELKLHSQEYEFIARISELNNTISEQEKDINKLKEDHENEKSEYSHQIKSLTEKVIDKEKEIKEKENKFNEKIYLKEKDIEYLYQEKEKIEFILASKDSEIQLYKSTLGSMYNSNSWKMGGFLRYIKRKLIVAKQIATLFLSLFLNLITFRKDKFKNKIKELKEIQYIKKSGQFDFTYYYNSYPDIAATKQNGIIHYVLNGAKEGRNPNVEFNTNEYLQSYSDVKESGINAFVHYLKYGRKEGRLSTSPETVIDDINESESNSKVTEEISYFEEASPFDEVPENLPVNLIAFYLPQFHPIPENDEWWGKGFTEWTNVVNAKPQFEGHYQPHVPYDIGYYDLRVPEVMKGQVQMAKSFGISGFCFYYYKFGDKRLLEKPLDMFLEHKEWDINFCICWANENWTRRWDGNDQEILMQQINDDEYDIDFINDISKYIEDERYIKIDGKPLVIIYRPNLFPNIKGTIKTWKKHYKSKYGIELCFGMMQVFGENDPEKFGFDYAIEFPPQNVIYSEDRSVKPYENFYGSIFNIDKIISFTSQKLSKVTYNLFRGVMLNWDNTARRNNGSHIYLGNTPDKFRRWLTEACIDTLKHKTESERFVFINAWNEWAEGTHLEPDTKYGYAYLNRTKATLEYLDQVKMVLSSTDPQYEKLISIISNSVTTNRPRVLVVSYNFPRHDMSSGELRFYMILKMLSNYWDIDFCITPTHVNSLKTLDTYKYQKLLNGLGINVLPLEINSFTNYLEDVKYDGAYFNFYWVAESLINTFKNKQPNSFTITDSVDVHYAREFSQAELGQISFNKAESTKRKELSVYRNSDITIVVSDEDYELLYNQENVGEVIKIQNIVPQHKRKTGYRDQKVIFIGNYAWPPNPDAVTWFVKEVWPLVRKQCFDAEFLIIGSEPTKEVLALSKYKGVKVLGFVPDTKPYLEEAAVSVAPLRFGGGMKGKVNEALAYGLPVVSTSFGAQGFNAKHGKDMFIANEPEDFAEGVIRLLQDQKLQESIGLSGQELNASICSPEAIHKRILDFVAVADKVKNDSNSIIKKINHVLDFKYYINPIASIIIPVYNQWEYTLQCLDSIHRTINGIPLEIILMDDLSTDETINAKKYLQNVRIIRNDKNLGFLQNCNKGASVAKGEYIILLNNDTIVKDGWLQWLLKTFEQKQDAGLVGSKLIFGNGKLQEAGGVVFSDGSAMNYGREDDPYLPQYNYLKESDYISGASICIPKKVWNELNGFDTIYSPAYYEDTDMAMRIRQSGYKVYYQPMSEVIHLEGISHGTDLNLGVKQKQVDNHKIFFKRWRETLEKENFERGENLFLSRDRGKSIPALLILMNLDSLKYEPEYIIQYINRRYGDDRNIKILEVKNKYNIEVFKEFQNKGIEILTKGLESETENNVNIDWRIFSNLVIQDRQTLDYWLANNKLNISNDVYIDVIY